MGLRRGEAELGIVDAQPRFELFVYVEDVDKVLDRLRAEGVRILREAQDMACEELAE